MLHYLQYTIITNSGLWASILTPKVYHYSTEKSSPTQRVSAAPVGGRKVHKQAENTAEIIVITHT